MSTRETYLYNLLSAYGTCAVSIVECGENTLFTAHFMLTGHELGADRPVHAYDAVLGLGRRRTVGEIDNFVRHVDMRRVDDEIIITHNTEIRMDLGEWIRSRVVGKGAAAAAA